MERRRNRGASTVEWILLITVAVAVGLAATRLIQSQLSAAGERASDCIAAAQNGGSCGAGASAAFAPAAAGTDTAAPNSLSGPELVDRVSSAPQRGNVVSRFVGDLASATGHGVERAIDLGRVFDGMDPSMKTLFGIMVPGSQLYTTEIGRSFTKGVVVDGAGGLLSGVLQMVTDPVGTLEGLGNLVVALATDFPGTVGKVWGTIKTEWQRDPARFVGNAAFQVASLFVAPAKAGQVGEVTRIVEGANDVSRTVEAERTLQAANELGRGTEDANDVVRAAKTYERPSGFRAGVRDEAWESAVEPATGRARDPVSGRFMSKKEPWDMGHKPGYEFRKHQASAAERKLTRKEFLDEYNNPEHYRPELPSSNRSHKGENVTDDYFGP
jgi:hypothetical protein